MIPSKSMFYLMAKITGEDLEIIISVSHSHTDNTPMFNYVINRKYQNKH